VSRTGRSVLVLAAPAILAAAVFYRAVRTFFAVDDFGYLGVGTPEWPGIVSFFATRFLSGPVAFWAARSAFGFDPLPYHLLVLALHLVNAWLAYGLVLRLEPSRRAWAAAAAIVFAIHPVAYTPLAWVAAGFNEVIPQTLALSSLLVAFRWVERGDVAWLLGALVLLVVAAGFKQHVVLLPISMALLAGHLVARGQRERERRTMRRRLAGLLAPAVAFSVLLALVVGPSAARLLGAPYRQDWSAASLASTVPRVLANSLNPLAIAREPLGYQDVTLFSPGPGDAILPRAVLLAVSAIVIGVTARQGLARIAIVLGCSSRRSRFPRARRTTSSPTTATSACRRRPR
jgi:hypothetical protein